MDILIMFNEHHDYCSHKILVIPVNFQTCLPLHFCFIVCNLWAPYQVSPVGLYEVLSQGAYMLLYSR